MLAVCALPAVLQVDLSALEKPELSPGSGGTSALPMLDTTLPPEEIAGALESRRALLMQRESGLQSWAVQLQLQASRLAAQAKAAQEQKEASDKAVQVSWTRCGSNQQLALLVAALQCKMWCSLTGIHAPKSHMGVRHCLKDACATLQECASIKAESKQLRQQMESQAAEIATERQRLQQQAAELQVQRQTLDKREEQSRKDAEGGPRSSLMQEPVA
jgi:hypothetical protein